VREHILPLSPHKPPGPHPASQEGTAERPTAVAAAAGMLLQGCSETQGSRKVRRALPASPLFGSACC
jgi:hypothetical protein